MSAGGVGAGGGSEGGRDSARKSHPWRPALLGPTCPGRKTASVSTRCRRAHASHAREKATWLYSTVLPMIFVGTRDVIVS
eukprot:3551737-Rhodomonas_salina.3